LSLAAAYVKNHALRFILLITSDSVCSALLALSGSPAGAVGIFIISGFVINIIIMAVVPDGKILFSLRDLPAALCGAAAVAAISAAAAAVKPALFLIPGVNPAVIFPLFCILFTAGYFIIRESHGGVND